MIREFSQARVFSFNGTCEATIFVYVISRLLGVFQQKINIPMGTNSAPLLTGLLLYSYEADCMQGLLKKNKKAISSFRTKQE